MTMKHPLPALLFSIAALAGFCTGAQSATQPPAKTKAAQEVQAQLVDEGIYETGGNAENALTPQSQPAGLRLVTSTSTLVAKKGVSFGFRFALKAPLNGRIPGFEMLTSHPPMRVADGIVSTSQTTPIEIEFTDGAARDGNIYMLSEDFEVLPGIWTLEIRYKGKSLMSRKFTLK